MRWIVSLYLFSTTAAFAAPLDIVNVGAPAINCKFDNDCTITVADSSEHFTIGPTTGDAFLQSRTWPVGEAGTAAEGLYGYQYRLDLRQLAGITALPCVNSLNIDFGPMVQIDYNDDGNADDVWVVTSGGLGTVAPSSADKTGNTITFTFSPPVCAGPSPGNGETSYFFGLTSAKPARHVTARIWDTLGGTTDLDARAPQHTFTFVIPGWWWLAVLSALVIAGGFLWQRKRGGGQSG
jgi:hypothetical protein